MSSHLKISNQKNAVFLFLRNDYSIIAAEIKLLGQNMKIQLIKAGDIYLTALDDLKMLYILIHTLCPQTPSIFIAICCASSGSFKEQQQRLHWENTK